MERHVKVAMPARNKIRKSSRLRTLVEAERGEEMTARPSEDRCSRCGDQTAGATLCEACIEDDTAREKRDNWARDTAEGDR
jgi:ribosomal protein L37E